MKPDRNNSEEVRLIQEQGQAWGLEVAKGDATKLVHFARLLDEYDRANVTGTHGVKEIVRRHVVDAMSCLLISQVAEAKALIDVGSGGGLPGIPLRVLSPRARVDLLEATGKKARFLVEACRELGLTNGKVINVRAEEAGISPVNRENYDVAIARALARLDIILEYCMPLLQVGGVLVAMKGKLEPEETQHGEIAAKLLGAKLEQVVPVHMLHAGKLRRNLVVYRKVSETSRRYPRKVGIPAKRPLGS